MKILVVDDADFTSLFYSRVLGNSHNVRVCKDAYSFLLAFGKDRPDLVIIDLHMQNMSGADAIRKTEDKEVKVVIVSADSLDHINRQAQQLKGEGFNVVAYRNKPIMADELIEMIETL